MQMSAKKKIAWNVVDLVFDKTALVPGGLKTMAGIRLMHTQKYIFLYFTVLVIIILSVVLMNSAIIKVRFLCHSLSDLHLRRAQ